MPRKIYVRNGGIPVFSFLVLALFAVLGFFLFAVFGVAVLAGAAVLGLGTSVVRMLFSGGKKQKSPHGKTSAEDSSSITLDKSDYEIRDLD